MCLFKGERKSSFIGMFGTIRKFVHVELNKSKVKAVINVAVCVTELNCFVVDNPY